MYLRGNCICRYGNNIQSNLPLSWPMLRLLSRLAISSWMSVLSRSLLNNFTLDNDGRLCIDFIFLMLLFSICKYMCPKICQYMCQQICKYMCQQIGQYMCQQICKYMCQQICKYMCQQICKYTSVNHYSL